MVDLTELFLQDNGDLTITSEGQAEITKACTKLTDVQWPIVVDS
jgi:hypothetical protein